MLTYLDYIRGAKSIEEDALRYINEIIDNLKKYYPDTKMKSWYVTSSKPQDTGFISSISLNTDSIKFSITITQYVMENPRGSKPIKFFKNFNISNTIYIDIQFINVECGHEGGAYARGSAEEVSMRMKLILDKMILDNKNVLDFYQKMTEQDVVEIFQELTDIIGENPEIKRSDRGGSSGIAGERYFVLYNINALNTQIDRKYTPSDKWVSIVSELRDIDYRLRSGYNSYLTYDVVKGNMDISIFLKSS